MSKIKDPNCWESFACENAEFYIVTDPKVDYGSAEGKEQFYRSGETLTHQRLDRVRSKLPAWDMAIEIGCGIGRLALSHAEVFQRIRAVDVAPTMLARLRETAAQRGLANIETFLPEDSWDDKSSADYAYSFLVFQHIEGLRVIDDYLDRISAALRPGGIAQLQFDTRPQSLTYHIRNALPDVVLPRTWRRGIRRIRRDEGDLRRSITSRGLDILEEDGRGSSLHVFVLRKPG